MADEQLLAHAVDALSKPGALPPDVLGALSHLVLGDLEAVERAWRGLPSERKLDVLGQLSRSEHELARQDFNAVYQLALADADPAVRRMAAESIIAENGIAPLETLLRLAAEDPEPLVREAVVAALGNFALMAELAEIPSSWAERLRTQLLGILNNSAEPLGVRREALATLGYFEGREIDRAIEAGFEDASLHLWALRAMGRSADPDWLDTLLDEASHPDPAVRQEVARACGEIGDERAAETIADLVDDTELEVRLAAIAALGEIGGEEAREALLYALQDERSIVRDAAEKALTELEETEDPLDL